MRLSARAGVHKPRSIAAFAALAMLLSMVPVLVGPLPAGAIESQPESPIGNPDLNPSCGLDILLVLDETGSMGNDETALEDAYRSFILSLENSGTRIGVVDFSSRNTNGNAGEADRVSNWPDDGDTDHSGSDLDYAIPGYVETSTANVSAGGVLRDYVDGTPDGYEPGGFTNWQEALWAADEFEQDHGNADLVVFFTDGDPNTVDSATPGFNGTNGELDDSQAEMDTAASWAVEYSNDLKDGGTHVLGFGLGLGGANSTSRLASVTGPNGAANIGAFDASTTDYVTFSSASDIGAAFDALANQLCNTTINITKWIPDSPTDTFNENTGVGTGFVTDSGWTFDVDLSDNNGVSWVNGGPPAATDGTGSVQFTYNLDNRGDTADATFTETVMDGYGLLGGNCVVTPIEGPAGAAEVFTANGWTVNDIPDRATVDCDVYNQASFLSLNKTVVADDGGNPSESQFTLTANGVSNGGVVSGQGDQGPDLVPADSYNLSESGPSGYTSSGWSCGNAEMTDADTVVLPIGSHVICSITNNDIPPTLTLEKAIDDTYGGDASVGDWQLTATRQGGGGLLQGTHGVSNQVPGGTYDLTEANGPDNYEQVGWSCTNGDDDGTVTLASGDDVTCTVTNAALPASLTLVKEVAPNNFGATADPGDWTLSANGPGANDFSGDGTASDATLPEGTYALSETGGPAGWEPAGEWSCTDGTYDPDTDSVTLAIGDDAVCTMTNQAIQPTITLHKQVNSVFGGDATYEDFLLTATHDTVSFSISGYNDVGDNGDAAVIDAAVLVGDYTLSETAEVSGYTAADSWVCLADDGVFDGVDGLTLAAGQHADCTITNSDDAPTITVRKSVTNNFGGELDELDFPLMLDDVTVTHDVAVQVVSNNTYVVSEDLAGISGYEQVGPVSCVIGDGDPFDLTNGSIVLAEGQDATCTITNTDLPGSITVVKETVPVGSQLDFGLFVAEGDGPPLNVDSGETLDNLSAGEYTVGEAGLEGWEQLSFVCEDEDDIVDHDGGSFDLANGQDVTCTITNAELPTVTVEKVAIGDDEATFGFSGDLGAFSFDEEGGSQTFTVEPDEYAVTETNAEFWALTGIQCTEGATSDLGQASAFFEVEYGDHQTCTFTNERLPESIEVVTSGVCIGDSPYLQYTVNPINFDGTDVTVTWLDIDPQDPLYEQAGQPLQGTMLWPGTVETAPGDAIDWPGWLYVDPDTQQEIALGTPGGVWMQGSDGYEDTRPTASIMFTVNPDVVAAVAYPGGIEEPDCDGPPPQIWVEKEIIGEVAGPVEFTFETTGFTLDDNTLGDGDVGRSGELAVGDGYAVSEIVPDGWLDPVVSCDDGSDPSNIDLSVGETVTCTFQNEIEPVVEASVLVTVAGSCTLEGDQEVGSIEVVISVDNGATVVIKDGETIIATLTESGSVAAEVGKTYTWEATANTADDFTFPPGFVSSGDVEVGRCNLPFTGFFADELAGIALSLILAGGLAVLASRRRGRYEDLDR